MSVRTAVSCAYPEVALYSIKQLEARQVMESMVEALGELDG